MKKIRKIIAFTLIIISNYSFCMEQNNQAIVKKSTHTKNHSQAKEQNSNKNLILVLKQNLETTNGIMYNAISPSFQYDMLKSYIETNRMDRLRLCLTYKFNPNRYHLQLSLLHCAIKCRVPKAITILSEYNADLIPFDKNGKTPLDYAVSLGFKECIIAMANAIKIRHNTLVIRENHCGLTKHILNTTLPCTKCIDELSQQLEKHRLSDPCVERKDFENSIKNLQPQTPYITETLNNNHATEADSGSTSKRSGSDS